MPTLIDGHITHDGDGIAVADDDGALSWARLGERVNRWLDLFARRGLRPGDRVACVLGNRRETFEVLLACLHGGLTAVPVNWHLTDGEIAYVLADSGSRALVTEGAYLPTVARAADTAEAHDAGGPTRNRRFVLGDLDGRGFEAAEPLLAAGDGGERDDQTCGATMLYTSGTTGRPKGVINNLFVTGAPFSDVERLGRYAREVLRVPARERVLLDGPWYHSAQLFFALLSLLQGSRLVIRPRFEPAATLEVIDRERITAVHLVPTQLLRLLRLDEPLRREFSGASLRVAWHGGGPCPADVKRRMIEWWGPVLVEYYGATEGGAVTLIDSREWLSRPGSVGRAVPAYEILVVDRDGAPLPPGRPGRVFVRRRSGRTFSFHNAPDKTRAAHLEPGVFTFGEIGHLDGDGYLFLSGREQDMIVTGGVNVYPAEVEEVLLRHPGVQDAAVVGIPDREYGERVTAVVQRAPGAPVEMATVLDAHCRASLAGFKAPRTYRFVDELPREPTGKLRKDALRASVADVAGVGSGR